jgi:hypothetical protein
VLERSKQKCQLPDNGQLSCLCRERRRAPSWRATWIFKVDEAVIVKNRSGVARSWPNPSQDSASAEGPSVPSWGLVPAAGRAPWLGLAGEPVALRAPEALPLLLAEVASPYLPRKRWTTAEEYRSLEPPSVVALQAVVAAVVAVVVVAVDLQEGHRHEQQSRYVPRSFFSAPDAQPTRCRWRTLARPPRETAAARSLRQSSQWAVLMAVDWVDRQPSRARSCSIAPSGDSFPLDRSRVVLSPPQYADTFADARSAVPATV